MMPPPFPPARDADTEPGIHSAQDVLALRRENARLRRERDELRDASPSVPPPTRRQRTVKTALLTGKWAVLLPLVALGARAAARQWPELTELVDGVLGALGL